MAEPFPPARLRALWTFDDPAAALATFTALADDAGLPAGHRAELATQRARALGLLGRFAEADAVLDAVPAGDDVVGVRRELERGRLRRSAGDPDAATPHFVVAADLAAALGATALEVDALHMLALADPDRHEEWAARALARTAADDDPDVRRWAIALHNNLGWHLHDAGRFDAALVHLEAAHAAALEHGTPEEEQVGRWAVARCLRSLGRRDEALAMQRRLLAERPDDPYVHEELAALTAEVPQDGPPGG